MPKALSNKRSIERSDTGSSRADSRLIADTTVDFAPVLGRQRKPWNPNWFVYEFMRSRFVNHTQRVLDYGCGQGISTLRLARIGYEVCGVSDSSSDLHIARGLARRYHLADCCRFRTMKMSTLQVKPDTIDAVVGFDFFTSGDLPSAIEEIYRVLKPGGVAVLHGQADETLFDPSGAISFAGVEAGAEDNQADQCELTASYLAMIEGMFKRVEQESFTILNRLDRFTMTCDQQMLDRLQRLDHRMHVACPALADLGNTVVLICHK